MNTVMKLLGSALLLGTTSTVSAWGGNNGWDWNPWPAWTPMYWMEEMVGDNDWYGNNYYGGPYGYAPYGYGPGPYYGGYGAPYYGSGYPYGGNAPYYGMPYYGAPGPY